MTRRTSRICLSTLTLAFVALATSGCGMLDYSADFASNELFYADVPFRTKAPGDRAVFVAPVKDDRDGLVLPLHENGFPIQYGVDSFWERPVTDMLGEVLTRQLDDSELFPEVSTLASADSLILKPSLVAFTTGAKEGVSGSMTFAEVGMRIEVLGPADGNGKRTLWHDQVYANRQVSEQRRKPISPYRLVGRALQVAMSNALSGLDGSNVARSHVPVEIMLPSEDAPAAEASAKRR